MRRRPLLLVVALVLAGAAAAGAWLLAPAPPTAGATRGARLYAELCTACHGADGRGSWRSTISLIRPGDLADRERMAAHTDAYLFDLIKQGGATIGRPGMPAFGATLNDEAIRALVTHLRTLGAAPPR